LPAERPPPYPPRRIHHQPKRRRTHRRVEQYDPPVVSRQNVVSANVVERERNRRQHPRGHPFRIQLEPTSSHHPDGEHTAYHRQRNRRYPLRRRLLQAARHHVHQHHHRRLILQDDRRGDIRSLNREVVEI